MTELATLPLELVDAGMRALESWQDAEARMNAKARERG